MEIYRYRHKLIAEDCDCKRQLRLHTLLNIIQQASIAHTEQLGMGRHMTLDRGLLWVIIAEHLSISRLPEYDEEIEIISYPGTTMHYFFPRYFIINDAKGETIIRASAMWALIDEKSRQMADPSEHGVHIEGGENCDELPVKMRLSLPQLEEEVLQAKAAYSQVDLNGHLHNASYLDLALDSLDSTYLMAHCPEDIELVFKKEIRLDEHFCITRMQKDDSWYFANEHFALKMQFK